MAAAAAAPVTARSSGVLSFGRDVDEALDSQQLWPFVDRATSRLDAIVIAVYENECRHLFYGWGNAVGIHSFPPFDRFPYSDDTGAYRQNSLSSIRPIPGYDWVSEWQNWVSPDGKTDDEGYEYATLWTQMGNGSTSSTATENSLTRLRRRCVRRVMSKVNTSELLEGSRAARSSTFNPYQLRMQIVRAQVTKGLPVLNVLGTKIYVQVVYGDVELGRTQSVPLKGGKAEFNEGFSKEVQRIDDAIPVTLVLQMEKLTSKAHTIGSKVIPKEHLWNVKNRRLVSNITLDEKHGAGDIDIEIYLEFRELFCVQPIMGAAQLSNFSIKMQRSVTFDHTNCQGDMVNKFKLTERILTDCGVSTGIESSLLTVSATEFLLPSDVYDVLRDLRNMKSMSFTYNEAFFAASKTNYPKGHLKYSSVILFHTIAGVDFKPSDAYKEEIVTQISDVSNHNEKLLNSRQLIYPNDYLFIKTPKPTVFTMLVKYETGTTYALQFASFATYVRAAQTMLLISVGKDVEFSCAASLAVYDADCNNASINPAANPRKGLRRASRERGIENINIRDRVVSANYPPDWMDIQLLINTEHDLSISMWVKQTGMNEATAQVISFSSIVYVELLNCHMLPLSHVLSLSELTLSIPTDFADDVTLSSVTLHTVTGERKIFLGNDIVAKSSSSTGLTSFHGASGVHGPCQLYSISNSPINLFIPGAVAQELTSSQMQGEDKAVVKISAVLDCRVNSSSGPDGAAGNSGKAIPKTPKRRTVIQKALEAVVQLPTSRNDCNNPDAVALSIDDEQMIECRLRPHYKLDAIRLTVQRVSNIIGVDANGKSDVYFRVYLVDAMGIITNNIGDSGAKAGTKLSNFVNTGANNMRRSSAAVSPGEVYRSFVCKSTVNPFWPDEGAIILTEEEHRLSHAVDVLVEFWDANRLNADVCLGELRIPIINIQNSESLSLRCSEIAPSIKMPKSAVEKKYFGTVNYSCSRVRLDPQPLAADGTTLPNSETADSVPLRQINMSVIGCLEPSSTHLFRWPALLLTSETAEIPPSLNMHISFDGIVLSYPGKKAEGGKKAKLELLGSCRESASFDTDSLFREVVIPWSQVNMNRTVPMCASTLLIEVTLHRVFRNDTTIDIGEASDVKQPGDSNHSNKPRQSKGASMFPSSAKEFEATVVVGPCPAFHLMELVESRIATHDVRQQMQECPSTVAGMEATAKVLLSEIQQISSDIVVSGMMSASSYQASSDSVRDQFANLLSSSTENTDHVSAHSNCWELYTSSSQSRRNLRLLSLRRLRLKGYFSLLMENLTRLRSKTQDPNLAQAVSRLSNQVSIEKHVNKKISTLIAQNKKLNEKLDDMIYSLEADVVDVIISGLSTPAAAPGVKKIPSNGENPLSVFARQLTSLVHSYFLNITWYFASVTDSGKFDMQSDPQSKHALLQALISKDDWIELLIGPHLNTCELKFSRRPLLSYIIDFDGLVSMFSSLLNAEIKHWDQKTIESFSKSHHQPATTPPAEATPPPAQEKDGLTNAAVLPWEVETVDKSYASPTSGSPRGPGILSPTYSLRRSLLISNIPENVRYQLQIQIGSKHVSPCSSMSSRNIARIAAINREVAVAVLSSYKRLGEGYHSAIETAVRRMQRLQFLRIRQEHRHQEEELGHTRASRPSLVLSAAASFRNSEKHPTSDNASSAADEDFYLGFLVSVANDAHRIVKEHLPLCESELQGYTDLHDPCLVNSCRLVHVERLEGFQDVDNIYNIISDRAVNAIANVVFFDLSTYFLGHFDGMWELHAVDPSSENKDPLNIILETVRDFSSNIGMRLEPEQHIELLNRCFRRIILRYMLFIRDQSLKNSSKRQPNQESEHDQLIRLSRIQHLPANIAHKAQNQLRLAINATEQLVGKGLIHFTSDLRLQSYDATDSTPAAAPQQQTVSVTNNNNINNDDLTVSMESFSATLTTDIIEPLEFSDLERRQFVMDYNSIRNYFTSMLTTSFPDNQDDRYIAFGLNQLDSIIRLLFQSTVDRFGFVENIEDTILAVWKTQTPAYHGNTSSNIDDQYDLAMCKYLGISSVSSMEESIRNNATTAKLKLQVVICAVGDRNN
jgi:hypothetical protein